jgi:hypothetical protein
MLFGKEKGKGKQERGKGGEKEGKKEGKKEGMEKGLQMVITLMHISSPFCRGATAHLCEGRIAAAIYDLLDDDWNDDDTLDADEGDDDFRVHNATSLPFAFLYKFFLLYERGVRMTINQNFVCGFFRIFTFHVSFFDFRYRFHSVFACHFHTHSMFQFFLFAF